ncbi:hypothetical protein ACFL6S_13845 [Candidatus Poribacteria bacterium]
MINVAAKSPQLKDTTFYPAALNLITGSKYYNGAGGDILYLALFAASGDSELDKMPERIAHSVNMLYSKHNIYRNITSILNSGTTENASMSSRQPELFPSFWCSYFAKIRRDVDLLLRLQIPDPLLTIRFLIILLNFHLSQYVIRRCIANKDLCKECVKKSDTEDCRPIVLLSFCNAISDKSQEQYRRHVQTIRSRLASNVERNVRKLADKTAADSIDKILEALAEEKNGFAKKQQTGSRFIKKMKEAELHTDASPVEKVSDAISRFYGRDRRQIDAIARLYSIQGGGAGLVAPKFSRYKRYVMESDLLETLAYVGIAKHRVERLAVDDLLKWWHREYGLVIGRPFVSSQAEVEALRIAFGREINEDILRENYRAFEELLVKTGILQKFSDATAMVVNRYKIEGVENAKKEF